METMSFWMKSKGYAVETTDSGDRAVEIIQSNPIDIVFLDVRMPKGGGIGTLTKIRAVKKDLPVILITAYPEDHVMQEARELGISGFFPKEGGLDTLAQVIEVALRTHKGLRT
ncbi:MAG: response regulator [Candidatus Omnitrophica bacterium]|nr:response regulator [Candidatus Omnitrophota bacterium]